MSWAGSRRFPAIRSRAAVLQALGSRRPGSPGCDHPACGPTRARRPRYSPLVSIRTLADARTVEAERFIQQSTSKGQATLQHNRIEQRTWRTGDPLRHFFKFGGPAPQRCQLRKPCSRPDQLRACQPVQGLRTSGLNSPRSTSDRAICLPALCADALGLETVIVPQPEEKLTHLLCELGSSFSLSFVQGREAEDCFA